MSKILITGATGQLGKAVIESLIKKVAVSELAVLVRDASKAENLKAQGVEVRIGDYNDESSLVNAFTGIDKLFFVSGNDIANRLLQHENVIKAARKAGVKHVIYTSIFRKNESENSPLGIVSDSHLQTEKWLKESGLPFTILKNSIYTDILPMFIGEQVVETGTIFFPAGDGKISFATRQDMAETIAAILTSEGHTNKEYDIINSETITFAEVATILSEIVGKPISYLSPTQSEYTQALSSAGVPMEYVRMFAGFAEAFKQQEFDQTNNLIETLSGKKPISAKEFLTKFYSVN